MKIFVLDNTLGHTPGRAGSAFSVGEKLAIVQGLDGLGIEYVEIGCPAANRGVRRFLEHARAEGGLRHARLVASARLDSIRDTLECDHEMDALLAADTPAVVLSANCWHAGPGGFHDYCQKIAAAVRFLKVRDKEVIFRVEDFFGCFGADPEFALRALEAASSSRADVLCLRDSTAGTLPQLLREICIEVRKRFEGTLGIAAQDELELGVANTLEAVEQGFTHVEGSINAYGSRRGATNLCAILSNLEHKLGHTTIGPQGLTEMAGVARLVAQAESAALGRRVPSTHPLKQYDGEPDLPQIDPELLNRLTESARRDALERVQLMEAEGYDLQSANGTLELIVRQSLHPELVPFEPEHYEMTSHSALYHGALSTATATIRVGETVRSESAQGSGPLNALERCLHQCLFAIYPDLAKVRVIDCSIRVMEHQQGTGARGRVALEWQDGDARWTTAGVSDDLIEAAWLALVDGLRLSLMRLGDRGAAKLPMAADTSWAV